MIQVNGVVSKVRSHGRKLRFVEILPKQSNNIEGAPAKVVIEDIDMNTNKPLEPRRVCFVLDEFRDEQSPLGFPAKKGDLRKGDIIRVQGEEDGNVVAVKQWEITWKRPEHCHVEYASQRHNSTGNKRKRRSDASNTGALCRHWAYDGKCSENGCSYRHGYLNDEEMERVQRNKERVLENVNRSKRPEMEYSSADPHANEDKASRATRARIFAEWLIDRFGVELLTKGTGVVDVAGGKGRLCIELIEHAKSKSLQTTVIDPVRRRTPIAKSRQKRLRKLGLNLPAFLTDELKPSYRCNSDQVRASLESCSLMVGMHTDQATDAIVSVALELGKPFALVPCCVFTDQFPYRRTPKGELVKTPAELVAWLKNLDPRIEEAHLGFQGRNKVLYMKPCDFQS